MREPGTEPAIHVQDPARQAAYFLTTDQLAEFRVDKGPDEVESGISFIVPVGLELIEELPALMRGLLQSSESGGDRHTQVPQAARV